MSPAAVDHPIASGGLGGLAPGAGRAGAAVVAAHPTPHAYEGGTSDVVAMCTPRGRRSPENRHNKQSTAGTNPCQSEWKGSHYGTH